MTVIPIVVEALRAISYRFEKFVMEIGIHIHVEHVQRTAFLGTTRILILVLDSYYLVQGHVSSLASG